MRTRSKLLIAAIGAVALLGIAVTAASASRLEVTNWERGFRIAWADLKLEAGGREMDCPVTLEGTFAANTFAKRAGTRVGSVTEARIGVCIRGALTVLRETLPWEVTYQSFGGTLPNITGITLNTVGMAFQTNIEGVVCLARTEAAHPFRDIANVNASNEIRTFEAERNAGIETTGGFFCSISGAAHFSGSGTATVRGGTETTRVRLIEATGPRLSPSPVAFGTVEPSSTTERTITLENGSTETTINEIRLTTGTSYSISDPNICRGRRLAASARCSFIVTFRAPAEPARTLTDTVNVETSAGRLTDSVSGSTPNVIATPSPVEFGRLAINTLARREVTITAGVEATIESIRMRSGTRFSITDPNRCIGTRLAASGRCTFNVIVETPAETERTLEDAILIGTSAGSIEDRVRAST